MPEEEKEQTPTTENSFKEGAEPSQILDADKISKLEDDKSSKTSIQPETEPTGFQKRINQLTAEKHELRRAIQELQSKIESNKTVSDKKRTTPPVLEEFDYDEDKYRDAVIDWKVNEQLTVFRREIDQRREIQNRVENNKEFQRKIKKANIPNYQEIAFDLTRAIPFSQEVVDVIQKMENGPEVVYHLGTNFDEADRISSMPPAIAAMELGVLSAKLKSVKKQEPSKTPESPVRLNKGGGGEINKKYEDMTMDEIMEADI